jgi:hypothetical protein
VLRIPKQGDRIVVPNASVVTNRGDSLGNLLCRVDMSLVCQDSIQNIKLLGALVNLGLELLVIKVNLVTRLFVKAKFLASLLVLSFIHARVPLRSPHMLN